jgi:hypothetical protein
MPAGAKAHLDCRSRSGLSRLGAAFGRFPPHNFPFPSGASAPQTLSQSGIEYFPTTFACLGNTDTHTYTHTYTHTHTHTCTTYIRTFVYLVFTMLACAHEHEHAHVRAFTHMYHHPTQQWLTVFGGICFMLVDLIDFQNGKNEPDGARSVIGIIIVMSVLPNPL